MENKTNLIKVLLFKQKTIKMKSFLLLIIFASFLFSCAEEDKSWQKTIDSLEAKTVEYQIEAEKKNELILNFNAKLDEFGNIHDSIQVRENKINLLKKQIKQRGYATRKESKILNSMLTEIDSFLVYNKELVAQFDSTDYKNATQEQIVKLLLSNIKDKQGKINNLKQSVVILKKQVKGLIVDNENLQQQTDYLIEEREVIKTIANKLTLNNFKLNLPLNVLKKTKKANNIDEITICFALNKNEIVESDSKTVYIRIIKPNGDLLSPSNNKLFTINNKELGYTIKKDIIYNPNKRTTYCEKWIRDYDQLVEGTYSIYLFVDGYELDTKTFTLYK